MTTVPSSGLPGTNYERTFIAIKPDGVQRGKVGVIISRFEDKGYKLVGMKMLSPSKEKAAGHYADLKKKPFFQGLVDYFSSGPIVAMCWEGMNAVVGGRTLLGATNPKDSLPGTIRGDLCIDIGRNVCHGSDSNDSAAHEINFWFDASELSSVTACADEWVYEKGAKVAPAGFAKVAPAPTGDNTAVVFIKPHAVNQKMAEVEVEDCKWIIKSPSDEVRCFMKNDGAVLDKDGKTVLGYINLEDLMVGSADEDFLGAVAENSDDEQESMTAEDKARMKKFEITDASDVTVGVIQELDPGFASLKDDSGRTITVIDDRGEMLSPYNIHMGNVEGFESSERAHFALLVLLIKRDACAE